MARVFFLVAFLISSSLYARVPHVIIDADTDNELDDVLAISGALMSGKLEIIGLTSAQWEGGNMKQGGNQKACKTEKSAYTSWLVNKIILELLHREKIPCLKGSESTVVYSSGGKNNEPRKSQASDFIIRKAHEIQSNEKITLICLGSLTNIASAVMSDPDIAKKISLYWVGTSYDFKRDIWGRVEFNAVNDLDALDVILDTKDLELHIMPNNVSGTLEFNNKDSLSRLAGEKDIGAFIKERWESIIEGHDWSSWTMWDLALIYAIIYPEWGQSKVVHTPPENTQRKVNIYTHIDYQCMTQEFWKNHN